MKFSQFKNAIGFIFGKPHTVYAHYGITHRCNLNCYMCQVKGDAEYRELSLGQIYGLAKNLARLGISYISIGGGEPLVRDDLTEAVRIFKKHSIRTRLLTNGVLLSESLARKLQISGLSDLSVSLDSLDREKYRYITGADCLTDVMDAITVTSKYFKNGVNLLNTVVSKINIEELPKLSIFAKEHRFKISLIPIENARDNFTLQDKEKIANILNSLDRKYVFNSTNFIRLLPDYLCGNFKNTGCLAGRLYLSIAPDGCIAPCHKYGFDGGDWLQHVSGCLGCMRPCWRDTDFVFKSSLAKLNMLKRLLFYI